MGLELVNSSRGQPVLPPPRACTRRDIARLRGRRRGVPRPVFAAMRLVRRELAGRVPLLGFGGTPWTLAAYLVEGGGSKHFEHLLAWSYTDPEGLAVLLDRIADTSIAYLRGQIAAGAQALQLFDTWGGAPRRSSAGARSPCRRSGRSWTRSHALPDAVPLIYYVNGGGITCWKGSKELPVDVLSVDWRQPLSTVRAAVGSRTLQGNFDPAGLLAPRPRNPERRVAMSRRGTGRRPHRQPRLAWHPAAGAGGSRQGVRRGGEETVRSRIDEPRRSGG